MTCRTPNVPSVTTPHRTGNSIRFPTLTSAVVERIWRGFEPDWSGWILRAAHGGLRRSRPPQDGAKGRLAQILDQHLVGPERLHDRSRVVPLVPQRLGPRVARSRPDAGRCS